MPVKLKRLPKKHVNRIDPTRTVTVRKRYVAEIRRRFARLRGDIVRLMMDDVFGIKRRLVGNVFCPTGEGGGVDPSCNDNDKIGTAAASNYITLQTKPEWGPDRRRFELDHPSGKGHLSMLDYGDHYRVTSSLVDDTLKGKGFGKALYKRAVELATSEGKELRSDNSITDDAARMWRGMGAKLKKTDFGQQYVLLTNAADDTTNVFCATGEGGGVDPSCSKDNTWFEGEKVDVRLPNIRRKIEQSLDAELLAIDKISDLLNEYDGDESEFPRWYRTNVPGEQDARSMSLGYRLKELVQKQKSLLSSDLAKAVGYTGYIGETTTNAASDDAKRAWQFKTSSEQVKAFQEWLRERFGHHLSIKQLMKRFAEEGYKRGIGRAFDDVEKPYAQGYALDASTGDFYAPNKTQFLRSAFGSPVGKERVEQLASRSFDDLKNVTSDMSTRMSRTLLEGLVDGSHPNEIAKRLSKDVDISQGRAETIARTEIIRAHAEGQLDAMQAMGVQEVGVQVEWATARDDKVCPYCESMEGVVLEIDKAHNMIPAHPNCRCAFMPAGDVLYPKPVSEAADEGLTENVYCATGEGGGIDPSCGASLPKAKDITQDGYKISKAIPEKDEQEESFREVADNVKSLGVREVGLSLFESAASLKGVSKEHLTRIKTVADKIKKTNTINPLVAVYDGKRLYTLDGDHRLKAMVMLGAKTVPAYVLHDLDEDKTLNTTLQQSIGLADESYEQHKQE